MSLVLEPSIIKFNCVVSKAVTEKRHGSCLVKKKKKITNSLVVLQSQKYAQHNSFCKMFIHIFLFTFIFLFKIDNFAMKLMSALIGKRIEEAFEEAQCSKALDARQTRWCICE